MEAVNRTNKPASQQACGTPRVLMAAFLLFIITLPFNPLHAQENKATEAVLQVGVYISPPFVMKKKEDYTGLAIELWERIAADLKLRYDYREFPTIRELVLATSAAEIDVALTNLTITEKRAQLIDFTHPWYDAGLRIMISDDRGAGFWDVIDGLKDSGHLRAYTWLLGIILVATILLTLFDRKFDKNFPRRWREGLAESLYSVMSIATSGKAARKNLFGWVGRIWSALWLICGVALLAYVTSSVTSVMTTLSLTNQIHGVADLPGKMVGVRTGSVAEEYARDNSLNFISFPNIDEAVSALRENTTDAIIGDAPVLEYFAHTHEDIPVTVVGPLFDRDKYGFGLTRHNALTRPLTIEIIGAHEDDLIMELRAKYFGPAP